MNELNLTLPRDSDEFDLKTPIVFVQDLNVWTVPAGFRTDLASVPRLLWPLLPPFGRCYVWAAVLHDWLYVSRAVSRKEADDAFRVQMIADGTKPWLAFVMWAAVRVFGGRVWRKSA